MTIGITYDILKYLMDLVEDDIRENENVQQIEKVDTNIGVLMGEDLKWQKEEQQHQPVKSTSIDDFVLSKALTQIIADAISKAVEDAINKSHKNEKR